MLSSCNTFSQRACSLCEANWFKNGHSSPLYLKPVAPACALNAIHLSQHLFVPSQFIQIMLSSLCLTHCATNGNLWQAPSSSLLKRCKNVKIQTNFGFHCTLKPTLLPEMLLRTFFLTWTLKFKAFGPVKFKTLTFLDYVAWYSDNMQDNIAMYYNKCQACGISNVNI